MDTTQEPVDAIKKWQEWYRSNRVVAQLDQPLVTKESREQLHDTSSVISPLDCSTDVLNDYCKTMAFQKAKEYFSDTLAEFQDELSGKELYKAFYAAAIEHVEYAEKEYNKAKQLLNSLKGID